MKALRNSLPLLLAVLLFASGCSVSVEDHDEKAKKDVDISTPVGDLSVRTNTQASEVGLPVYPGARALREPGEDESSANVNIATPWFGLQVVAAKFESDDKPDKILEFYRKEMGTYGDVRECRGEADFKNGGEFVCREEKNGKEIQLVVGTEQRHRLLVVKPRGEGSEFAMVYIRTRGEREML